MRILYMVFVILMGMHFGHAQPFLISCPIPAPTTTWVNETSTSLGISTFSGDVRITGSFTVNAGTFTFFGANVEILTNNFIFVNPGCTLQILNGSILTNFQGLWGGIYVLPGGHLEIKDSEVCGAIDAVYINNAGSSTPASFDIKDSGLRRNVTGINVNNYTLGTYPGYVTGTHFEGGTLASSGTYTNSHRGVYSTNISGGTGLTIGEDNTIASANRFTRMDYGVHAINSTLNVWNNEFEDLQDFAGLGYGYAVYANTNPPPGPYILSVGTSLTRKNYMLDCRIGVFSRGMEAVNVSDNEMNRTSEPFDVGVWITRTDETIIVGANTIRNIDDAAILLDENPGASGGPVDASVNNNILEGSFAETRGVVVDDLVGGITIRLNQIDQVHRGIIGQSLLSASKVRIDSNRVLFGYPGAPVTEPAVGILAIQAEEPLIYQNEIEGNCPFSAGGGPCTTSTANNRLIRGIQLVKTHKALVFTNKVSYCGAGLFVLQDNLEGNAVCNEFFDTYSGVVWSSLGIGEFGVTYLGAERVFGGFGPTPPPTVSSDNRWTTSIPPYEPFRSISITGSVAGSVDWYYRSAATFDFPAGTNTLIGVFPTTILNEVLGSNTAICDTLALFREGEIPIGEQESFGMSQYRESEIDALLTSPNPTGISGGLYAFLAAAYRSGIVNDKVQALLGQTSIADLALIEAMYREGNLSSALTVLNGLTPINTEESLLRDVWSIRLNHASSDPYLTWNEEDAQSLREIAYRDLEDAGSAAILAQSILGLTLLPNDWIAEESADRLASTASNLNRIYPNPAQTVVFLDTNSEPASAVLTDLQGQVLRSIRIQAESMGSVDISNLHQGLYLIQISKDSGITETFKLFINR